MVRVLRLRTHVGVEIDYRQWSPRCLAASLCLVARRDPALLKRFGRALRSARIRAAVTQEELAGRAGVDVSYVSLIENGHKGPSVEVVFALADALHIPPHVLVEAAERRTRA